MEIGVVEQRLRRQLAPHAGAAAQRVERGRECQPFTDARVHEASHADPVDRQQAALPVTVPGCQREVAADAAQRGFAVAAQGGREVAQISRCTAGTAPARVAVDHHQEAVDLDQAQRGGIAVGCHCGLRLRPPRGPSGVDAARAEHRGQVRAGVDTRVGGEPPAQAFHAPSLAVLVDDVLLAKTPVPASCASQSPVIASTRSRQTRRENV